MTRIFISRPLPDEVVAAVRALGEVDQRLETTPMSAAEMQRALADYDIVLPTLGDRFSADIFAAVPEKRARLLANFGMGFNHIDVAAAGAAGIAVTNTPGAVTDATADIALMLMLMSCRRASEGDRLVRSGQWQGWHPVQMLGLHMSGKTVGIVGMGRIGQAVARRAHFGFGMEVVYHNRSQKAVEMPARQVDSLEALAGAADVVVISVPANPQTHHLIGAPFFAAMKPTAHFVNVARGDIVDEAALVAALEAGQIAGAGLDVYEHEPEVPAALRAMENVALLPHLGTAALEVRAAMGMRAVENIRAFLAGAPLPDQV